MQILEDRQSSEWGDTLTDFLVVGNRECLQFREAASDSTHSLPAQLIFTSPKFLKAGEVSRHDECSLVAVTVDAYATNNSTDAQ